MRLTARNVRIVSMNTHPQGRNRDSSNQNHKPATQAARLVVHCCYRCRQRLLEVVLNIQLARRAVRLYSYDLAPLHINKANRRKWLRAVEMLGPKWLLAKPVQKEILQ